MAVAREVEATELYGVMKAGDEFDWSDPIHVRPDRSPEQKRRVARGAFEELARRARGRRAAFEVRPAPPQHCLVLPVNVKGQRAATGCLIVRADARLASYMLKLATLLLERYDQADGADPPARRS
jgi:hypothetical protein